MDYGKYKYEQKKKSTSKKSHAAALKEVKLRPGTDQHDLNFKLNNARKFLMDGDKVKITVMFRGREMVHTYRGREQLDEVVKQLGSIAKVESTPRMEGRFMSMIVVGDRDAIAEARRQAGLAATPTDEERAEVDAIESDDLAAIEEHDDDEAADAAGRVKRTHVCARRRTSRADRNGDDMPKMKTHRGSAKRFSLTGTGKLKRNKAGKQHILTKKRTKRKRPMRQHDLVSDADASRVKRSLPYL